MPPINMLQRVMIQYKNERGTAFSLDVDGREYWVTARHILTGAKSKPYGVFPDKTVNVQLLNPGGDGEQWLPEKFTVLQPAEDVDVVVLVGDGLILTNVDPSPPASSEGLIGGKLRISGVRLWRRLANKSRHWKEKLLVAVYQTLRHFWHGRRYSSFDFGRDQQCRLLRRPSHHGHRQRSQHHRGDFGVFAGAERKSFAATAFPNKHGSPSRLNGDGKPDLAAEGGGRRA